MAFLRKDSRGRSPFWICCYAAADGRRLQKSTKQKDRKKAMEFCRAVEEAASKARNGDLTKANAQNLVSDMLEKVTGERLQTYTARGWLEQWLASKQGGIAEFSEKRYKQVIHGFLQHLGRKADQNIEAITPQDIVNFRDALKKSGRAPQTVNNIIKKLLATPFGVAMRFGIIRINPIAVVGKLREEKNEKDIFTPEEVARLIAVADSEWQGVIRVAYYTGARLGDVAGLTWKNIDLEQDTLSFTQGKTGGKVTLVLHGELSKWLLTQPAPDDENTPLFPNLAKKSVSGKSGLSAHFHKIMEKTGVGYEVRREAKGAGRTIKSRGFHSFRHSFNSALANAGVPVEVRQQFTGHSSAEMNAHYTHLDMKTMRDAVEKLPSL